MNAPARSENNDNLQGNQSLKLMVNGFVCPESICPLAIEVKRGMAIRSKEGQEIGKVAAIVLNDDNRKATHILLSRLPERRGYLEVSVDLIVEVQEENVQLSIPVAAIESLPLWRST